MTERVLMIEDDESLAEMVAEYLRTFGIEVVLQGKARRGMELLGKESFDALILDVMLPDLDGFEVCRRVRAVSDIAILMLTARGDEMDRIVGLELGADDYLPKPFNPRELLARLRAILRRRGVPKSDRAKVLHFGRLEINLDSRVVRLDGEPRSLTSYQFDLLQVLAANAGRVMSRDRLMDGIRGEPLDAFDRSIDVHISRIRAAIEDEPKRPRRIITIRGVGYVFAQHQDEDARS